MKNLFVILFAFAINPAFSQFHFPDLSPKGSITQRVGFTTIEIQYERPAARGRKVIGDLVPFNKLWRTGAGNCTKIKFSNRVVINGKKINAGTYSVFTIPNKEEWTVILNSDTTLYGTGRYNSGKDAIRFSAKSERTNRYYESFTIDIDVVPNNAVIYLSWEKTQIHFTVDTETDQQTTDYIRKTLLTDQSTDSEEYATAGEYYFYLNTELDQALILVDKAIQRKKEPWYFRLKVDVLERQKKYTEAINVVNQAIEVITKKSDWDDQTKQKVIEENKLRIKKLESLK